MTRKPLRVRHANQRDAYIKSLEETGAELVTCLRDLMNYCGGWDAPPDHPCAKARDLLARLDEERRFR